MRWCGSTLLICIGTPIVNKLEDLFTLLRFLRISPWHEWNEFRDQIVKLERRHPEKAVAKAQAILKRVMLRRNKGELDVGMWSLTLSTDSKLNGQPLIDLPSKTVSTPSLHFTDQDENEY